MKKTCLHDKHLAAGGRLVDFAGWRMPVTYGSQLAEHHAVRREAGMFDVSHMTCIEVAGEEAIPLLQRLLVGDPDTCPPGRGFYTLLLNREGGVVDDLIAYRFSATHFRLITNACSHDAVLAWLKEQGSGFRATLSERLDLAIIAVQGPKAASRCAQALPPSLSAPMANLGRFHFFHQGQFMAARTGYTGEDGFEILLPDVEAEGLWEALLAAGVKPCGLGARDTLRLEAGLHLYGNDMDAEVDPFTAGLAWTIHWEPLGRDFIGRAALESLREFPTSHKRLGVVVTDKGIPRDHQRLFIGDEQVGVITSGGYSPTLEMGIALARVTRDVRPGDAVSVEVRGKRLSALAVRPPFVKDGKKAF